MIDHFQWHDPAKLMPAIREEDFKQFDLLDAWRSRRAVPAEWDDRRLLCRAMFGPPPTEKGDRIQMDLVRALVATYGASTVREIPVDRFAEFLTKLEAILK